ncbi:hypothetical protein PM082_017030 [Marasmius tenuissimus]|nr:hypothetical protein PM082_017030 [Marasmius tenuissimus]
MPPRLSKRQQRALDELQELSQASSSKVEESEESEEDAYNAGGAKTGFAAVLVPDDDEDEEEASPAKSSKSKKSKKKKKTGTTASVKPPDVQQPVSGSETPKLSQSEKKAAKKAKAKAKKEKENDGLDEIDRALEEVSMKHPEFQKPVLASSSTPGESSSSHNLLTRLSPLLSVSLSHLDSSAELRRFFGSKVVKSSAAQDPPARGSSSRRGRANA